MGFLGAEKMGVTLALILLCGFAVTAAHEGCSHGHHHHHHDHEDQTIRMRALLPEELAEEEDLKLLRFGGEDHHHHDHHHHVVEDAADLSGLGLWIHAMGCSLLVSLASLICLIFLPVIFIRGKPSKAVVDSLAMFGAGAMLGDAFLHQLPHAFGGKHSHSHDHNLDHPHLHDHSGPDNSQSHAHSLKDLSVGLCILAGIILFLLVEKLVRYVEDSSGEVSTWGHSHHHRQHKSAKLKTDNDADENPQGSEANKHEISEESESKGKVVDGGPVYNPSEESHQANLRKRNLGDGAPENNSVTDNGIIPSDSRNESEPKEEAKSSNLVFGYLNLFSDGVHNFTDGIALGSAFLLYGSVGGWSRTLFLLAHEIPQEIGDFGILVRSGFSVSAALFFNFLSALVALAGTAVALLWGQDPGQSSLIEGFTAGGFIYISIAVLAEMNTGRSTLKSGAIHVVSLVAGMAVALCISLVE